MQLKNPYVSVLLPAKISNFLNQADGYFDDSFFLYIVREASVVVIFSWDVSFLLSSNISGNTPLPTIQGRFSPLQDENSLGQVLTVFYPHPTKKDTLQICKYTIKLKYMHSSRNNVTHCAPKLGGRGMLTVLVAMNPKHDM